MDNPRTTLTDGRQVYPEHRNKIVDGPRKGQQQDYVVLAEEERAKGFVRPVRHTTLLTIETSNMFALKKVLEQCQIECRNARP